MINEEVKKIVEENPIAVATANDNMPNVIAVAYVKVVSETEIIITDNYMKGTKENIKNNPNVCLAAWNADWNGYKIIGQAEYFDSGKWLDYVKAMPENNDCPAKGAILVKVSNIKKLS